MLKRKFEDNHLERYDHLILKDGREVIFLRYIDGKIHEYKEYDIIQDKEPLGGRNVYLS